MIFFMISLVYTLKWEPFELEASTMHRPSYPFTDI